MFGQTIRTERPGDLPAHAPVALEVRNLTRSGAFSDISFTLHQGEILGIAGLLGAGRTELLRSIFGADPADSGEVVIGETAVRPILSRPDEATWCRADAGESKGGRADPELPAHVSICALPASTA